MVTRKTLFRSSPVSTSPFKPATDQARPQNDHIKALNHQEPRIFLARTFKFTPKAQPRLVKRMAAEVLIDKEDMTSLPKRLMRIPKLLTGRSARSNPMVKMTSQMEDHFKPSRWLGHVKRVLRQIVSKAIANGLVGSQWNMVTVERVTNVTTSLNPSTLSSDLQTELLSVVISDEDGDILEEIIMWAPIGTVIHRAAIDLQSDVPQILGAIVSPAKPSATSHPTGNYNALRSDVNENKSAQDYHSESTILLITEQGSSKSNDPDSEFTHQVRNPSKSVILYAFEFWASAVLHPRISKATTVLKVVEPSEPFKNLDWSPTVFTLNLSETAPGK
ncbi:hypothetical protein CROQUDRAFT_410580 [Cronartium quercuum f. sp. fusiforme G11]|uniref:Uncharacterized protein n=1 Tax=Cronartium quercuum f. sp. fusiforme G11 TaxID=708437 RepID=A0A9P6NQE9_9BASI|nr:hypothetical protein CROQUDRAFT_410580 [Cronartium quercuum f. sp. fusiforme G11]